MVEPNSNKQTAELHNISAYTSLSFPSASTGTFDSESRLPVSFIRF